MTPEERASAVMAQWTTDDAKNHVRLAVAIRAAVAEAREACAVYLEILAENHPHLADAYRHAAENVRAAGDTMREAAAIRARGSA